MRYLKMMGLATIAVAGLMAVADAGSASATELTKEGGAVVTTSSTIAFTTEGTTVFHPPIGDIFCEESTFSGTTSNESNATINVNLGAVTCNKGNATFNTLIKGSLSIEAISGTSNGTVRSTGWEFTVELLGSHCIFKTNSTDIGTLTGSNATGKTATLDISGTIPRTGGRSGALCGMTAQWTGSYSFTTPDILNVRP